MSVLAFFSIFKELKSAIIAGNSILWVYDPDSMGSNLTAHTDKSERLAFSFECFAFRMKFGNNSCECR